MLRTLHHRGPDANGSCTSTLGDRQVFLGHARLSIIDLSAAGNQPMLTDDGEIALVFNGEIYNFQELRTRLLGDVAFRSRTDTEVVLRLYERFGIRCLDELNGDFALALLDRRLGKLFLVRDRAGVKPLYYAMQGDSLLFGSEIKALLAGGLRAELDTAGLQRYFAFKYTPGLKTLFRGVLRVPAAHYLEVDIASGRHRLEPFWRPAFGARREVTYGEAQEELRHLLADATRLRLIADVPVGNFLSGGLDSSILASFIRDNDRITHYCASRSDADTQAEGTTSDWHYARRLADEWRLRLLEIDTGSQNLTLEQLRTAVQFGDDLIADAAQIPSYLITRHAAGTSKVFLSGMGADELFLGYVGQQLTLLSQYANHVPGANAALRGLAGLDQGKGLFKPYRRYLYRLGKYVNYPDWRFAVFSLIGDFENSVAVVAGDRRELESYLAGYFPEGCRPFEAYKPFEYDNFLQKNLGYVDRMSMGNSVEVRVPFLDHRVMNFAWSLPRRYKLGVMGGIKRILIDAFRDRVPRYVVDRRKAGFGMPIRSIFRSREAVHELLEVRALSSLGPFDIDHIGRLIDAHADGREDNSSIIYALVAFQEWYRTWFGAK